MKKYQRSAAGEARRIEALRKVIGTPQWTKSVSDAVRTAFKSDPTYAKRISASRKEKFKRQGYLNTPETIEKIRVAKLGSVPWNKGKKGTVKHLLEWKIKLSESQKGEKSHFWKGGVTPLHRALRECFKYEEWRKSVFERDLYTCQNCYESGGLLEADHILPFCRYPDLIFEITNGRTLCKECHKLIGWNLSKERLSQKLVCTERV